MTKQFYIPSYFRSETIDKYRQQGAAGNLHYSNIELPKMIIRLSLHFGFCFGVKNALEIAYRAIKDNPGKRIFLLSEIIHNQAVNDDLIKQGTRFIFNSKGEEIFPIADLSSEDVVIVPAFGVSVEIKNRLIDLEIDTISYDTTCPFVKKVWHKAAELGKAGFSVVLHGEKNHEETKATFSYCAMHAPTIIIRNKKEANILATFIESTQSPCEFDSHFQDAKSKEFNCSTDLQRIGIVNQTTMLASDTKEISRIIEQSLISRYGIANIKQHFADTKDTLCYATSENQKATFELSTSGADLALVVGSYNSSNTSHLVEVCEHTLPTFFIKDKNELISNTMIRHYDIINRSIKTTSNWLSKKQCSEKPVIAITAGASCPDKLIEEVINRLSSL